MKLLNKLREPMKGLLQLQRLLQRLLELMIKAKILSSQMSLIDHNHIMKMLHEPIYIYKKKRILILN
jgi:hypothetical protein